MANNKPGILRNTRRMKKGISLRRNKKGRSKHGNKKRVSMRGRNKGSKHIRRKKSIKVKSSNDTAGGLLSNIFAVLVFATTALAVAARTNDVSNIKPDSLWIVGCTGNTCRSPTLRIAAAEELGYNITTCGTGVRTPGQGVTPAALTAMEHRFESELALKLMHEHKSRKCDVCDMMTDLDNKVFAVVSQSNANDLYALHHDCGVSSGKSKMNVVVLGDIDELEETCGQLKNDPYDYTRDATGELYDKDAERKAYEDMVIHAGKCMIATEKYITEHDLGHLLTE